MNIVTTLTHNDKGVAKIVAKGAGKQRTINYDHSVSHERNHGTAAGTLALALGMKDSPEIVHESLTEGGKHRFTFPV